jgi:hypothetical protein
MVFNVNPGPMSAAPANEEILSTGSRIAEHRHFWRTLKTISGEESYPDE